MKNKKIIIIGSIGCIILIVISIIGFVLWNRSSKSEIIPSQSNKKVSSNTEATLQKAPTPTSTKSNVKNLGNNIFLETTDSTYKTATAKPTGIFTTGQEGDIVLSALGFNNSGGSKLYNHTGTVATDGTHLLLADRNNNRVLIWNSLPTSDVAPDFVLGQKDMTSIAPGTGIDQMNWPVSVSAKNGKVVVTDTNNNRILIWNAFPTKSGQAADLIINTASITPTGGDKKRTILWPWGVWTDGTKLAVTSTQSSTILLWNTFPTRNDQASDLYLTGSNHIGTPRTITSNGKNLIVGDHNSKAPNQRGGNGAFQLSQGIGNFFWKSWPTKNDQAYDFFMSDPFDPQGAWMQGDFTAEGKLVMVGTKLHIWNQFPTDANDVSDLMIAGDGSDSQPQTPPNQPNAQPYVPEKLAQIRTPQNPPQGTPNPGSNNNEQSENRNRYKFSFFGGDGSGVAIAGERVYVSVSNGNKIAGFKQIPTKAEAMPDFVIGSPDLNTNTLETNFIMSNPVPATDGKSLFVSSDFDRKLYVYKSLPDESGAKPDYVYSLPEAPWANAIYGNTFAVGGRDTLWLWRSLPTAGQAPDVVIKGKVGSVTLSDIKGIAMDNKYFYVSDNRENKIYVWDGAPAATSEPKFIIPFEVPTRISSDGTYFVVTQTEPRAGAAPVNVYNVATLSSSAKPQGISGTGKFNLPQSASVVAGQLFVADTSFNRTLIWKDIKNALAGKQADIILGAKTLTDQTPEIGTDKQFMPAAIAFDGSYLWVGEFKFSERLVRYRVK